MQYIFSGRTSESATVRFEVKDPPLRLKFAGAEGEDYTLSLLLSGGIYLAVTVTSPSAVKDIATLRNQTATVCNSIYDAASFMNCISVRVTLTSVLEIETGRYWTFEDRVPELLATASERPLDTESFFGLALTDAYLRSALSDLKAAIDTPNDTSFYCYRAVETLMQGYKRPDDDSKCGWFRLREAINVTQDWIRPLTDKSVSNRHGELKGLSGQERVMLMYRAWTIVYRYAKLRGLNTVRLPESAFPVLSA